MKRRERMLITAVNQQLPFTNSASRADGGGGGGGGGAAGSREARHWIRNYQNHFPIFSGNADDDDSPHFMHDTF